jgi:hypothetical protein
VSYNHRKAKSNVLCLIFQTYRYRLMKMYSTVLGNRAMKLSNFSLFGSLALVAACSGTVTPSTVSSGGPDADSGVADPFNADPTCTSNKMSGTATGPDMRPGEACNACHSKRAPSKVMAFAGTVYPTGHEPDQCLGVGGTAAGIEVVITDSANKELRLPVRASGDFEIYARDPKATALKAPFHVRVEQDGKTREMGRVLAAGEGDCNSCHTAIGSNGAPGRITVPAP